MEEIKGTLDFDMFKLVDCNRKIDKIHVRNLANAIEKQNLLAIRPILIDEENVVLDGQHRLEAAKQLNTLIYYVKIKSNDHSEMAVLNQHNKNWKIGDYLNFHAKKAKNKNYLKILQIMLQMGWGIQEFFLYTEYPIRKKEARMEFEEGRYVFESIEEDLMTYYSQWKAFKDFVDSKQLEHAPCVSSLVFRDAFLYFSKCKQINLDQFWEKFRGNVNLFYRCRNRDDYLDLFLRIYNHQSPYKLEKGMLSHESF